MNIRSCGIISMTIGILILISVIMVLISAEVVGDDMNKQIEPYEVTPIILKGLSLVSGALIMIGIVEDISRTESIRTKDGKIMNILNRNICRFSLGVWIAIIACMALFLGWCTQAYSILD